MIVALAGNTSLAPDEDKTTGQTLHDIRDEFVRLYKGHIDAVIARNDVLVHKLVEKIHALQFRALEVVYLRLGTIGRIWYQNIGRVYASRPLNETVDRKAKEYYDTIEEFGTDLPIVGDVALSRQDPAFAIG